MVKNLKIVLENATNVYQPGEIVTGQLLVEVDKPKPFRTITVQISGQALTLTTFNAQNNIVKDSMTVWRAEQTEDGSYVELAAGTHNFPFQFALPLNIPPSFQGQHGRIIYRILGKVSSGLLKFSHSATHTLRSTVYNSVAFADARCLLPQRYEDEIRVATTCIPCLRGSVITSLDIPRTGFCHGESITFTANVTNNGPTPVQLFVALKRQERYGSSKMVLENVAAVNSNIVQKRQSTTWNGAIHIPLGVPQTLHNCSNISVEYKLDFNMTVSRILPVVSSNRYPIQTIPVVIGDTTDANRAQISRLANAVLPPVAQTCQGIAGPVAPAIATTQQPVMMPLLAPAVDPFGTYPRQYVPQQQPYQPGAGGEATVIQAASNPMLSQPAASQRPSLAAASFWPTAGQVPYAGGGQQQAQGQLGEMDGQSPSAPVSGFTGAAGASPFVDTAGTAHGGGPPPILPGEMPPPYEEVQKKAM